MNILITGGAGYIGSHVAKWFLTNTANNIFIIDNLSTGFQETIDRLKTIRDFEFIKEDLSNWIKIENILSTVKADAVIHFAASLIVPESVEKPIKYYLNNTANTTHLIKCCIDNSVNKFIFSSTAAVYGEPTAKIALSGVDEAFKTDPINPYGKSKLFIEEVLKDTSAAYSNFKYVILRYFNVAGADKDGLIGQSTKNATHLIKIAAQTALGMRDSMQIFGNDYNTPDGTCIRDYIDVDDLALAHIEALKYLRRSSKSNIFNCGYAKGYSVREVINTMKNVSGVDFKVDIGPRRKGDPAVLIADNSKIRNVMKWEPKYDNLSLICKKAYEWEKTLFNQS